MSRTVYALLVGIDKYPPEVRSLAGCVNDIRRVEQLLQERIAGAGDRFAPLVLTDSAAKRQAIINAFGAHLGQAGQEDVALFYYSGHGSQQSTPQAFWHLEPDHLDETLVCYDSRSGSWDLADKELAHLISGVAQSGAHVVVILDCCHSGSGTRNSEAPEEGVRIRRMPTDQRLRPLDTYIVSPEQAGALQPRARGGDRSDWYALPSGRHIVLSACSAEETAKELHLGGEQRGAFSYYLLDTLLHSGSALTYRDLFKRVHSQVQLCVSAQSPQIEATRTNDLNQPFMGGVIQSSPAYFTVSFDRQRGWVIDGGSVHGIPSPSDQETTRLALFPLDTPVGQIRDLSAALDEARVTQVFPGQSTIEVTTTQGSPLDQAQTYKAIVTSLPLPPLVIALEGDTDALALLRAALATAEPNNQPSLLLREGDRTEADFYVEAAEERYRIRRQGDQTALIVDTAGFNQAGAQLAVQRLEQIARRLMVGALSNPAGTLPRDAVQMEIQLLDNRGQWKPAPANAAIRLEYQWVDGVWRQPQFKLKLTNRSDRRLFCMLFDLPESFGIFPILPGGGIWLDPGQETWANQGEPFFGEVLDSLWRAGVIEFKDTLKLIVCTEESDATLLQQDDLPVSVRRRAAPRLPGRMHTLNRLMARVPSRHISAQPSNSEVFADWITDAVSFSVIRPLEAAQTPEAGRAISLGHGITLHGHAKFTAVARLADITQAGRDAGDMTLPPIVRDHPEVFKPFEFSSGRSGEPGLSVLELSQVQDYQTVRPAAPLVVEIGQPLADDEALLPLGFDGEFYLPLGYARRNADSTEVILQQLPAPTTQGTRDLKGAIRIYFQKVVGQRIGLDFPYPILAAADVADDGSVTYHPAADAVAAKIAQARSILLYIHGITGETRSMVAGARTGWLGLPQPPPSLANQYDLILTFDYESINTTIEQTARDLKARLAAVGLGLDHGKTLHIIAHSMGGLVSRWFIEREQGNQVVQRLILVGTPSAGSPWPTVQDWAFAGLGLALNGLTAVAWPAKALATLVSATEAIDVSLDQMNPKSSFLASLNNSADPGVPYTIVAGNTSIIATAFENDPGKAKSRLARLWAKIKRTNWLHTGAGLAFFNQPNDIAVSVQSIRNVPDSRTPRPAKVEVPCDHITYFSTQVGLEALADAVAADPSAVH